MTSRAIEDGKSNSECLGYVSTRVESLGADCLLLSMNPWPRGKLVGNDSWRKAFKVQSSLLREPTTNHWPLSWRRPILNVRQLWPIHGRCSLCGFKYTASRLWLVWYSGRSKPGFYKVLALGSKQCAKSREVRRGSSPAEEPQLYIVL